MAAPRNPGGNAGKGRKPGTKNKYTVAIKEMVEQALTDVGGVDYLVAQAIANPKAFLTLVAKLMPNKVEADIKVFEGAALVEKLQQGRALAAKALEDGHDEHRVH